MMLSLFPSAIRDGRRTRFAEFPCCASNQDDSDLLQLLRAQAVQLPQESSNEQKRTRQIRFEGVPPLCEAHISNWSWRIFVHGVIDWVVRVIVRNIDGQRTCGTYRPVLDKENHRIVDQRLLRLSSRLACRQVRTRTTEHQACLVNDCNVR